MGTCSVLMRTHDRAINVVGLPIDLIGSIGFLLQGFKDLLPDTLFAPAIKTARQR